MDASRRVCCVWSTRSYDRLVCPPINGTGWTLFHYTSVLLFGQQRCGIKGFPWSECILVVCHILLSLTDEGLVRWWWYYLEAVLLIQKVDLLPILSQIWRTRRMTSRANWTCQEETAKRKIESEFRLCESKPKGQSFFVMINWWFLSFCPERLNNYCFGWVLLFVYWAMFRNHHMCNWWILISLSPRMCVVQYINQHTPRL